jgi:four helix bundle protein
MANPTPTHHPFRPIELLLRAIRVLRPVVAKIRKQDAHLADQLKRALTRAALNVAEGEHRVAGNRQRAFRTGAGEGREAIVGLRAALAWGYVTEAEIAKGIDHIDHALAILWKCR